MKKIKYLTVNAHYDMVHGKPLPIERDNDGSIFLRYNIEPEMSINGENDVEEQIGWQCYEVLTKVTPTKENLKRATIRSYVGESEEFALINAYNKHVLSIVIDEEAVTRYKDYLHFIEDVDVALREIISNNYDITI